MRIIRSLLALLFFIVIVNLLHAQNLVQSFISEKNISGITRFGSRVSYAGDVNGDGFDDLMVSASDYNYNTGRVYIFYGGSTFDTTPDVIFTGNAVGIGFGDQISDAGDVNNDGFDDIIISAYPAYYDLGRVYLYYGGSSMDTVADITFWGSKTGSYFASAISEAGDVNKDGFDDIVIAEYGYNSNYGRALVYFGGSTMNNVADVIVTGERGMNLGSDASSAGDVNNDGYDDIIVSAVFANTATGLAYIYYGGQNMNNVADVSMAGSANYDHFGRSVSCAGDVNNDGYDDVIVGASNYNSGYGAAYIYYGGSNMNNVSDLFVKGDLNTDSFGSTVSKAGDINNDGYDDVIIYAYRANYIGKTYVLLGGSNMNSTVDYTMDGFDKSDYFGQSISYAGDLNNDGIDDLVVGEQGYHTNTGSAFVYYGNTNFDVTPDWQAIGEESGAYFGYTVADAGDVNGDGYDDFIIGSDGYNQSAGHVFIHFGGMEVDSIADFTLTGEGRANSFGWSVSSAGDVNHDGFDDIIVGIPGYNSYTGKAYIYLGGNPMDTNPDVVLSGSTTNSFFGNSVSCAGDVNQDGYDDVIVGASGTRDINGKAYLYFGGMAMNAVADVVFTGESTNSKFGSSVSSAGDMNGDGYDDVIVAANEYGSTVGKVYVYLGGNSMNNIADLSMIGILYSKLGSSVSNAGDINKDGYDDIIVGASSHYASPNIGYAYIYYGGSTLDNSPDVTFTGEVVGNYFGCSVGGDVDLNNDGYNDVMIGSSGSKTDPGKMNIYFGGPSMNSVPDYTITGATPNDYFGFSVSKAGDINGDGCQEIIVGAYRHPFDGKVYVYNFDNQPTVLTNPITSITDSTATGNGLISFLGTTNPFQHGHCWNTTGNPTIADHKTELGVVLDTGSFVSSVAGLLPLTTYYIKAYATNSAGTSYGEERSFKTTGMLNQTITFDSIGFYIYGDSAIILHASSTSGLPVFFTSLNEDIATISGDTLQIVGAGTALLVASQPGNSEYRPAIAVQQPVTIDKANLTITADVLIKASGNEYVFSGREFVAAGLKYHDEIYTSEFESPGSLADAPVGIYILSANNAQGKGLENYYISYVEGQLIVIDNSDEINDSTIVGGDDRCFDALENIAVANTGSVVLESGSTSTFIAGNSIVFYPGFTANEGSSMSAYITPDSGFCFVNAPPVSVIYNLQKSNLMEESALNSQIKGLEKSFKIYPNPNKGNFTIEWKNFDSVSKVCLFNMLGEKILEVSNVSNSFPKIDVQGINKGVYFVRVNDSKNQLIKKMIIQ